MNFDGKGVLVTGAAAGIGEGIARAFLAAGATVLLTDFRADALDRTVESLAHDHGARAIGIVGDTRSARDVERACATLIDRHGRIDVAVMNAGIYPNTLVVDMDEEEWDRVLDTNAKGPFLVAREAARRMIAQGDGGKLITISSGAWQSARRGAAHYSASKAAVVMLTKVLALELAGRRINVNCIAPGLVEVHSEVSPLTTDYTSALTASIPWGRAGQPADIAAAALFLASEGADFITGAVLSVDGGSSAGRSFLPLSTPSA